MAASSTEPSKIFISYRRTEASWSTLWLAGELARQFGAGVVFRDVDSIRPGDDFAAEIEAAVGACSALLAVIGPQWLAMEGDARRRLDDPRDLVRLEIEAAIKRGVRLIPVLVDGARMPTADELPSGLRDLVRKQAVTLSPTSPDIHGLVAVLQTALAGRATEEQRTGGQARGSPQAANLIDEGFRLLRQKAFTEAETAFRGAIRHGDGSAGAYGGLGLILLSTTRYQEAEAAFREAIRLKPDLAELHNGLGEVLWETRRYPEAETAFRKTIRLDPDHSQAHYRLGLVLYATGRHPEAEAACRKAIRLDPDSAESHNGLAMVLGATGRLRAAEAAFRKAIRLDPAYAPAYYGLSQLLDHVGRYSEAETARQEALRLGT